MDCKKFWDARYEKGGNSGGGSYGRLAEFKIGTINKIIKSKKIKSIIDLGCGDGNIAKDIKVNKYFGYDFSPVVIKKCQEMFDKDKGKKFTTSKAGLPKQADCTISLDVIFHLVNDKIYKAYLEDLFKRAEKCVVIYSSNKVAGWNGESMVRHRAITDDIDKWIKGWKLEKKIPNKYPVTDRKEPESFCDFYIYKRK